MPPTPCPSLFFRPCLVPSVFARLLASGCGRFSYPALAYSSCCRAARCAAFRPLSGSFAMPPSSCPCLFPPVCSCLSSPAFARLPSSLAFGRGLLISGCRSLFGAFSVSSCCVFRCSALCFCVGSSGSTAAYPAFGSPASGRCAS